MADHAPTPKRHAEHGSFTSKMEFFGPVELWICEECHFIEAFCMHPKNTWNEEGTSLTCDFCGIDGT